MANNILTDAPATYKGAGVFQGTKTNDTPRVPTDADTYVIAQWGIEVDEALFKLNELIQGDVAGGVAASVFQLLGGLQIAENAGLAGAAASDVTGTGVAVGSKGVANNSIQVQASAAGTAAVYFTSPTQLSAGSVSYSHSANELTLRANNTNIAKLTSASLLPIGTIDLGSNGARWQNAHFNNATVNQNFTWNGASFDLAGSDGMLLPRFTTAARNGLASAAGKFVYDTDLNKLYFHNGTVWVDASSGGTGATALDELTDVTLGGLTLADGQALSYNSASGVFENLPVQIMRDADCTVAELVGEMVYITGNEVAGVLQVAKCDITDKAKSIAWGMIISKPTTTTAKVVRIGDIEYVGSAFTAGEAVVVDTDSKPTTTAPVPGTGVTYYLQDLGVAIAVDKFSLNPSSQLLKVTGI